MLTPTVVAIGNRLFTHEELVAARHRMLGVKVPLTLRIWLATRLMTAVGLFIPLERLRERFVAQTPVLGFGADTLHLRLNRIADMPEVVVAEHRPVTVNVLIPTFTVDTISAGFFGVFAFARFIASCGFHARLVLFDNFNFNEDRFRAALSRTTGLTDLLDKVELAYIGARDKPLMVSADDIAVASVWYSAYFAEKIRVACDACRFLYLVQDYEPAFHPHNSIFALGHASYGLPAIPFFSTASLRRDFEARGLFPGTEWEDWCSFDNACSPAPDVAAALQARRTTIQRCFVFYSRPAVDRNMFELGALAIVEAFRQGVFDNGRNWRFFGMGIGAVEIYFDAKTKLVQMPRMSLDDYSKALSGFDVGLSLMASAHPSMTPMDLAGSGVPVVTNSFGVKQPDYFEAISSNIVCAEPSLQGLVDGIRAAVALSDDMDARLRGANLNFPTRWDETWTPRHKAFLARAIAAARSDGEHADG